MQPGRGLLIMTFYFLNDCARVSLDDETKMIIAKLVQQEQAAALILNKIDLATPEQVLVRTAELSTLFFLKRYS